jgi:hypothetical protein
MLLLSAATLAISAYGKYYLKRTQKHCSKLIYIKTSRHHCVHQNTSIIGQPQENSSIEMYTEPSQAE